MSDTLATGVGRWLAAVLTGLGGIYAVGLTVIVLASESSTRTPPQSVQIAISLATLLTAQVILALVVCVSRSVEGRLQLFSQLSVLFTSMFTATVSINRFVHLTVVRQAVKRGETDGLWMILPYSAKSIMFALEILGWGVFLALAMLLLAVVFRRGGIESALRWAAIAYAVFSLLGSVGYATGQRPLFLLGFTAWGFIFYLWSALLWVWFRRVESAR